MVALALALLGCVPEGFSQSSAPVFHLHATQTQQTHDAGSTIGLYFILERHDSTSKAEPVAGANVRVAVLEDGFVLAHQTVVTDEQGRTFASVTIAPASGAAHWSANASGMWLDSPFEAAAQGVVTFSRPPHEVLAENITHVRNDLESIQLRGVHLDEVGSHNLWMTSLRATGAVAFVILLVLLVVHVAHRV